MKFWSTQAKNFLQQSRCISIREESEVLFKNAKKGRRLDGFLGGKAYYLFLCSEGDKIAIVELWGSKAEMKSRVKDILNLLKHMEFDLD